MGKEYRMKAKGGRTFARLRNKRSSRAQWFLDRATIMFALMFVLLSVVFIMAAIVGAFAKDDEVSPAISPVVHLLDKNGRGFCTGFHAGNGYIVTAGHCGDIDVVTVKLSDDTTRVVQVAAMLDPSYGMEDVMILKIVSNYDAIGSDDLDCSGAVLPVGAEVRSTGYPGPLGLITVWGRIAGKPSPLPSPVADWMYPVLRVNISIDAGMSGAPLYDDITEKVVGIIVGADPSNRSLVVATRIDIACMLLTRPSENE